MMLKRLILAPALAALMALPAQAEKLSLDAISSYINGLKTARSMPTAAPPAAGC
jgi:hypothetical protein